MTKHEKTLQQNASYRSLSGYRGDSDANTGLKAENPSSLGLSGRYNFPHPVLVQVPSLPSACCPSLWPTGCGFGGYYGSMAIMPILRMTLPQFEGNWAHLGNVSPLPRMLPGVLLPPGLFPSSPAALPEHGC